MIFGRRARDKTRRAAQLHLQHIHGRMVVSPPADAGPMPARYVQNHVIDGVYPSGQGPFGIERDLVTELWFENLDHLRASTSTAYYLDNLKPDEPTFVDDQSVEKLIVRPELLLPGEFGQYKVFIGLASHDRPDADAFGQQLLSANGIGGAIRNTVMPPPDGSDPFVTIVYEAWFAALDDAYALVMSITGSLLQDDAGGFAVVAEQYDAARLAALF
jgi:EthD domain